MFDKGDKHHLDDSERAAAAAAVGKGLGKDSMDLYYSYATAPRDERPGASSENHTRVQNTLKKTFQVQPTQLRHTFDRVIGNYETRNENLVTSVWSSVNQEAMRGPWTSHTATEDSRVPHNSGGWAGCPTAATPKGHFAHRTSVNDKMLWCVPTLSAASTFLLPCCPRRSDSHCTGRAGDRATRLIACQLVS